MAIDLSAWVVIANQRVPKTNLVTDWFCGEVAPVHIGFYQRYFVDGVFMQFWDGATWRGRKNGVPHWRQVGDYPAWRGLTQSNSGAVR